MSENPNENNQPEVRGVSEEDKKHMATIQKIDDLNIVAHNHFMVNEFDSALEIAEQMVEMTKANNIQFLVEETEAFNQEILVAKERPKKIKAIKELAEDLKKKYEALVTDGKMTKAHKSVETFVARYENEANFWEFIAARIVRNKDTKLWDEFTDRQSILKSELTSLETQTKNAFEKGHLNLVSENLARAKELLMEFKIDDFRPQWQEIEQKYSDFLNKASEELAGLETKFEERINYNRLLAALDVCEKIIGIAQASGKSEIEIKYSTQLEQLKSVIGTREAEKVKELEELTQKAKDIEKVIEVEENVLPLVEDFSINELIGDISSDMDEILEQVGGLLNEYRVEIKTEIINKAFFTSASGEVLELEQDFEIKPKTENDVNYSVQSGLINPFDDAIEEGIITDFIPYNFEISEITYNGQVVDQLPDNTLTKEGLELRWQIQNIPPKDKVEIKYDLRRRISRTLIFILEGQVKIVKTHYNLSASELEGLYDAKMPLTNNYGSVLDGVVVEDIIPLYYLHFVKEPSNVLPAETSSSTMGELVRWNVGAMEKSTLNYHYKLLELYCLEEIKIDVNDLDQKALEAINKGNIIVALENYKKIKDTLIKFIN